MENILFKQKFRGFDRQEVLNYVDSLSNEMKKQSEDCETAKRNLENEIQNLNEKLSKNKEALDLSLKKLEEVTENFKELKQDNINLKNQINTYRGMILERDREISKIKAENKSLSEYKTTLEDENAQWKSKQDEIGSCMVEASVRAKQILEDAYRQADRTKNDLNINAVRLMDKVNGMKEEIHRLELQLDDSFNKLSMAMENMEKASNNVESQVKDYQSKIELIDVDENSSKDDKNLDNNEDTSSGKKLSDSVLDKISKILDK